MNPKKNTVAVTFRCDVAVADQLDELCRMMGIKRSVFLNSAITSEYGKMPGEPEVKRYAGTVQADYGDNEADDGTG